MNNKLLDVVKKIAKVDKTLAKEILAITKKPKATPEFKKELLYFYTSKKGKNYDLKYIKKEMKENGYTDIVAYAQSNMDTDDMANFAKNWMNQDLYSEGGKPYLQLHDHRTFWKEFDVPKDHKFDFEWWNMRVDDAAKDFKEYTGQTLYFFGRSSRHACVDLSLDNIINYDNLQELAEGYEKQCIENYEENVREALEGREGMEVQTSVGNTKLFDVARKIAKVDKALARELLATTLPTTVKSGLKEEAKPIVKEMADSFVKGLTKDFIENSLHNLDHFLNSGALSDDIDTQDLAKIVVLLGLENRLYSFKPLSAAQKKLYDHLKKF